MGIGRKLGRAFLMASKNVDRMNRGLDIVFGKDRKTPGEGFSNRKAGKRAAKFTERAKKGNKAGGIMDKNKDKNMFSGKKSDKNKDRKYF